MRLVQEVDTFPENRASADALEVFRKKFLDIDAVICAYADDVLSGKRSYNEHFRARPEPHHRRARYTSVHGKTVWTDVTFDFFDVTHEVRERVDRLRGAR